MNQVTLTGRLVRDIEIRVINDNSKVLENCIAVKRRVPKGSEEKTDFIDFDLWNQPAMYLEAYGQKGSMIALVGELRVDKFVDKDGNNRKKIFVRGERVELISSSNSQPTEKAEPVAKTAEQQNQEFSDMVKGTEYENQFGTYDPGFIESKDLSFY